MVLGHTVRMLFGALWRHPAVEEWIRACGAGRAAVVTALSVRQTAMPRTSLGHRSRLLMAIVAGLVANPVFATTYSYTAGHADIGLAYTSGTGAGSGPRLYLQFGGDAQASGLTNEQLVAGQPGGVIGEWSLQSFITVVPESVQAPRPAGAEWNFMGAPAGQPVWIFSQQNQPGVPFLGFNTEKAAGGTGTFTLANVITRPVDGEVSLFELGGFGTPDVVFWSSAIVGVDAVTVPAQTHVHYAFGFTKPGYYELQLVGTGNGFPGQATGTLAFQVVPEPAACMLAAIGVAAVLASRHWTRTKKSADPAADSVG